MDNVILKTESLTKNFQTATSNLEVLKGISLKVGRGEFTSITGPSGVGKSTLLHILGGLDQPTSGTVTACDKRIDGLGETELADYRNKKVGFVFQFHYLLEELTALENVMMPLMVRGWPRNKSTNASVKLLDDVGLGERRSHLPSQLSGGECQRVAVARAMAGSPEILLADEPTGNLDDETAESLHDLFVQLNREAEMTIIVATHDLSLASRASHRYRMADGQLVEKSV